MFRQPKHLYLFHHVGKCAGTTIVNAMGSMGRYGISLGFPSDTKSHVRRHVRRELVERRLPRSAIRGFFGHRVYHGLHHLCPHPPRYFTFLRHPVGRVISLYNFHCDAATDPKHVIHDRHRTRMFRNDRLIEFDEWLHEYYVGNQMVRFLSYAMETEIVHEPGEMTREHLAHAKRFIKRCWFVGFTESSQVDIPFVCQQMRVPTPTRRTNVSRKHLRIEKTPEYAEMIAERDALDMELYRFASEIRKTRDAEREST